MKRGLSGRKMVGNSCLSQAALATKLAAAPSIELLCPQSNKAMRFQ